MNVSSIDVFNDPPLPALLRIAAFVHPQLPHQQAYRSHGIGEGNGILDSNRENDCVQKRNGLLVVLRTNLLDSEGAPVDHVVGRARGFIESRSWMVHHVQKIFEIVNGCLLAQGDSLQIAIYKLLSLLLSVCAVLPR